ncbi:pyridoxal phosphate-dependent transferase [Kalaharituber pfeilii]|nr:pyridoxal phosphate-dependent transferase [Kalaharituber pfeilii]
MSTPPAPSTNPLLPPDIRPTLSALLSSLHNFTLSTYLPNPVPDTPDTPDKPNTATAFPLPTTSALSTALTNIAHSISRAGLGLEKTYEHLVHDVVPALGRSSLSSRYYGFVTGGTTPAALLADHLVTLTDTNVQVHLPLESLSTTLEHHTLCLLLRYLFRCPPSLFPARIFTTGATSSNILGLTCAREYIFHCPSSGGASVGALGLLEASRRSGISGIDILCAMPHASIYKAAGVLGLGKDSVKDIGRYKDGLPWELDMDALESYLAGKKENEGQGKRGVVVIMSWGEVNTGRFTSGIREVRRLVTKYCGAEAGRRAWIHVDAAFGIFARLFWSGKYACLGAAADGLECADSVTADGHKMLNVPYDCGIFFGRCPDLLHSALSSAAPYLSSSNDPIASGIPSPLNLGLENSRRFRALPVYATLVAYGTEAHLMLLKNMVLHARSIARFVNESAHYELLPRGTVVERDVYTIVLFSARDQELNKMLKDRINWHGRRGEGKDKPCEERGEGMYVSGTLWDGKPAVRIAVSNWRMTAEEGGEGGWGGVKEVLEGVVRVWEGEKRRGCIGEQE